MRALPLDWKGVDNCTATTPAQLMDDLCSLALATRTAAISEVNKVVACLEAIDAANALNCWRQFARTSVQCGGKLAHRFSKGPRAAIMPERISAADASCFAEDSLAFQSIAMHGFSQASLDPAGAGDDQGPQRTQWGPLTMAALPGFGVDALNTDALTLRLSMCNGRQQHRTW